MTLFVPSLCRERAQRAGQPMWECNRGRSRQDTADSHAFRGGPGKGPTQRPHEGRRPTAPSEDPSLRQPLYRRHQSRSPPAGAYGVTGPDPQRASQAASDPWSQCSARILRRDLRYRIYAPPATRNRADVARARRATPPISAGQSVGKAV